MITKAIVEQIVDRYHIRVRIPVLDRTLQSSIHTPTEELNVALVCVPPNFSPNIKCGDIVFVSIDNTDEENVVILGYLYRSDETMPYADMILNELSVQSIAKFPADTTIGNVSGKEISMLSSVNDNIQRQIDHLQQQIDRLYSQINGKE